MSNYVLLILAVVSVLSFLLGVSTVVTSNVLAKREELPPEKQIFSTPLHVVIWEPSSNVKDEPWSIYRIIMDPAPNLESIFSCRNETVARKITSLLEVRANDERLRNAAREKAMSLKGAVDLVE